MVAEQVAKPFNRMRRRHACPPDPPVRAFFLTSVSGGGPVNLVLLGPIASSPAE